MSTATPLFVIGLNRSGTKWLSNILCQHPDVAGVLHERFTGILETNMLDTIPRVFPDLSAGDDFVAVVELWASTDFFRIAGVEKEWLYRLRPRPGDPFALFGALMEEMARRRGARYWLQKTGPRQALQAAPRFPRAQWVTIERESLDTLRSTFFLLSRGRESIRTRTILSHRLQERLLERVGRGLGALPASFESLKKDAESETRRVCAALGLSFEPALLERRYRPNTSFRSDGERAFAFSRAERGRIRLTRALGDLLPVGTLEAIRKVLARPEAHLVRGTFAEVKERYDLD